MARKLQPVEPFTLAGSPSHGRPPKFYRPDQFVPESDPAVAKMPHMFRDEDGMIGPWDWQDDEPKRGPGRPRKVAADD